VKENLQSKIQFSQLLYL